MKIRLVIFILPIVAILVGCASSPTPLVASPTVSPTVTHVSSSSKIQSTRIPTLTPWPTFTPGITPSPTPTLFPSYTPGPTPTLGTGPEIQFLYLVNGEVFLYDMRTWSSEKVMVQTTGGIRKAELSPDGNWLAFWDEELKLVEKPFDGIPIVIPSLVYEKISMKFSSSSDMLAFSDEQGLKLYFLDGQTTLTLYEQNISPSDISLWNYYSPIQWSPDNQWLWINLTHWESEERILYNIPSQREIIYSGCYQNINWRADSQAYYSVVSPSEYQGCGENGGIFFEEIANDLAVSEDRKYPPLEPIELKKSSFSEFRLSPDEKNIVFIESINNGGNSDEYHLRLLDLSSLEVRELDSSQGIFSNPGWSEDGKKIFYTLISRVNSLDVATGEITALFSVPGNALILSTLSGSEWLVVASESYAGGPWNRLYLVNSVTGERVVVANVGVQDYLGQVFTEE